MGRSRPGLLAKPWLGAWFTLLIGIGFAPTSAQAECHSRDRPEIAWESSIDLGSYVSPPPTRPSAPERRQTCSGPSCQSRPAAPLAQVRTAPDGPGVWATVPVLWLPPRPSACGHVGDSTERGPTPPGAVVFHPPRPVSGSSRV